MVLCPPEALLREMLSRYESEQLKRGKRELIVVIMSTRGAAACEAAPVANLQTVYTSSETEP